MNPQRNTVDDNINWNNSVGNFYSCFSVYPYLFRFNRYAYIERADKLSIKVACVGDIIAYVFFFTTCIKIIIQKFQVRCLAKNIALIISA